MVVGSAVKQSGRRGRRMTVVGLVVAAVVATACSSSKNSSTGASTNNGSTTTGAAGGANSVLGPAKAATGTPVKIGFITDGKSTNIDNSSEVAAAQAAAKYANGYLGGIAGHPIQLDVCDDHQTPSGTTDCDSQMITDKVPIVLNNVTGNGDPLLKSLEAAKVPLLAYASSVQSILLSTDAYVITNGLTAAFAGPAKIGQLAGAKHGAVFVIDVPAASGPAKTLDPAIFKNAGINTVDVVPVPPGTADMTPQVQAELGKNPDIVQVFGDVTFCTSALKALKTLGYSKTTVVIAQCIDANSSTAIPGGYAGMKLVTSYTTDPSDADVKVYKAAMAQYSPGTNPYANGVTPGGWAVVLGLARGLSTMTGDVTSASLEASLASMPPTPIPFGGGTTFQCDRKQVAITPAICSTGALEATLNQTGQPQGSFQPLDATALLKLG
jgi:branched-chain amino acid transport system substrate-binding protein